MGNTSARMSALGWSVIALEPDPVLFGRLERRLGGFARCESFLDHRPTAPYDAIVAESVFFQMDLARVFGHARTLLKPGGHLAFVEAVWTDTVTSAQSRDLHDVTGQLFGISVGSREPLTWRDWSKQLQDSGFETVHAELLPRGSAGRPPTSDWSASAWAIARDPRLVVWMARYRLRKRRVRMPSGIQESWVFLGRVPESHKSS